MIRFPFLAALAFVTVVAAGLPATAATLEYTFTVPLDVKASGLNIGSSTNGAAAGKAVTLSVTCAVGPASLGYSTGTNTATGATGTGTTNNVFGKQAVVVVTVDAELRKHNGTEKLGTGTTLQPVQPNGYYTCWGTFASGQTPVNFLPTTALPKPSTPASDAWQTETNLQGESQVKLGN